MLIPFLLVAFLSLAPDVQAQDAAKTGSVTGTVVEARTGAPLAAVLVKIQSTGQQSFSDAEGRFAIADVPAGAQTVLVSVVGYGLVRRDVTVVAGAPVDITIPVAEGASTYVEDVAVSASPFREAEPGVAGQSVLGSRDLLALRGLVADDPFRAVQVLPGVSTGDDFRAEFALRGLQLALQIGHGARLGRRRSPPSQPPAGRSFRSSTYKLMRRFRRRNFLQYKKK